MGKRHILYIAITVCMGILLLSVPVMANGHSEVMTAVQTESSAAGQSENREPGTAPEEIDGNGDTQDKQTSTIYEDEVPKSEGKLIVKGSNRGIMFVCIFAGVLMLGVAFTVIRERAQR